MTDAAAEPAQVGGCVETVPSGAQRPVLKETFPARGLSGYAATLTVVVEHGKGEAVLARGLEFQSQSEAAKALKSSGFHLPSQDGGAGATIAVAAPDPATPDRAKTILDLPLLVLPPEPGRHTLTLPPLPIAVSRASGEIATVCTASHSIVVEDPIASTPDAKPLPNPPPRPQREEWTALKRGLMYAAIGIAAGALLAYAIWWYRRRPKPVPPPPPPRPAWEVAIEKLDEVRHAGLLEVGRFGEYFDRVNDVIRSYLGARYGFDGLESTTDETLAALSRAQLQGISYGELVEFLRECDLVKFANVVPSPEECSRALDAGERIVRSTTPHLAPLRATEEAKGGAA